MQLFFMVLSLVLLFPYFEKVLLEKLLNITLDSYTMEKNRRLIFYPQDFPSDANKGEFMQIGNWIIMVGVVQKEREPICG